MNLSLTPHPVHKDQQQIENDGKRIGYCGTKPAMPINLIFHHHPGQVEEIREFVEEQVGDVSKVAMVPKDVAPKPRRVKARA